MQWHTQTVSGWIRALPSEWIAQSPKTNLAFAWMHIYLAQGRVDSAEATAQQSRLIAAGEAILAGSMWNSSGGFVAGIFMQGGFMFVSDVMLRTTMFSKWTAWAGMLSNGFDLLHVFVTLVAPTLGFTLLTIGGVFYVLWFPLLSHDLIKAGR